VTPVFLVGWEAVAGAALVAVELAVRELWARQEVLDDLQRRHERPVALCHGTTVALLNSLLHRELLEELAEK
jgi:heme exporter protein D